MIDENINKIRSDIPDYVVLIAISKTKQNEDIMKAYENGIWLAMFRAIK